MTDIIELSDWLKSQSDFTTKKRLVVFTDVIHTPSGEKVIEGFRYFRNTIDEVLAAFETGDATALQALEYALDEDGDPDTTSVAILLAYTKSGAFLAAQPQEYRDYEPVLVRAPNYLTAAPALAEIAFELDQSS